MVLLAILALSGCAIESQSGSGTDLYAVLRHSFLADGVVKSDQALKQDTMQKACSSPTPPSAEEEQRLSAEAMKSIPVPSDGNYLGDWKAGEVIAQNGRGMQFSDPATSSKNPNGGNCYACHQMSPAEISFGTLGPSLYRYATIRGQSSEVVRYTWEKIFDAHASNACSIMPRFGRKAILTEAQMKDVMALLFDPASPVNQ